jgi:hypothetical protein
MNELTKKRLLPMHNLKTNFDKFSEQLKKTLHDMLLPDGNFKPYLRKPKLNDTDVLALTLCAESMSIDSENYFWSKLKTDHFHDFPTLTHRCNFNRRKKNLSPYIVEYNKRLAKIMNADETAFIVDSMPIPVANIAREKRSTICKEHFDAAPDKGYSAITRSYFYGYKLHLVCSVRGVVHSIQLSKASVHDLRYLQEIKYSKLNNCLLLGDKGYLSAEVKTDLFNSAKIDLQTPKRNNQNGKEHYPFIFKKCRKRIETTFSQFCDQFLIKRNYAKTYNGLCTRISSKIAAYTTLQYFNIQNQKPINHIKHALAA